MDPNERRELINKAKAGEVVTARKKSEPAVFPAWMLGRMEKIVREFEHDARCSIAEAAVKTETLMDRSDADFRARLLRASMSLAKFGMLTHACMTTEAA
jgi:hypothetical protein